MASKRKFIIDTDAGIDDAQAIFMALATPDVHVLGITCVNGNAPAAQVGRNVLRILQQAKRLQIPVYVGCNEPLLGDIQPTSHYHGSDGFGDVSDANAPDQSYIQSEHAVQALLRMSKEVAGEASLVCIGPLTNIAVALRLDPLFGRRLKHCYIMGGKLPGQRQYVCKDFYTKLRGPDTPINAFLRTLEKKSVEYSHTHNWGRFIPADEILMAVALRNEYSN